MLNLYQLRKSAQPPPPPMATPSALQVPQPNPIITPASVKRHVTTAEAPTMTLAEAAAAAQASQRQYELLMMQEMARREQASGREGGKRFSGGTHQITKSRVRQQD